MTKMIIDDLPLFPTEAQIAKAVLGSRASEWRGFAMIEERHGLPQIDALAGGRYWPAVRAYFDRRAGLIRDWPPAANHGVEKWDETPRRARKGIKRSSGSN